MTIPKRDIGIIGKGAVGTVLGCLMAKHLGRSPVFFNRRGSGAHQAELSDMPETHHLDSPKASEADLQNLKLVLVAVKAHQVEAALRTHAPKLPAGAAIVILSNGMLDRHLSNLTLTNLALHWRRGVVSYAARKIGPHKWQLTNAAGSLIFGPLVANTAEPLAIEAELLAALPGALWQADVAPAVREKWLFNATLNSLCGMYNLESNGAAMEREAELMAMFIEAAELGVELWGPWSVPRTELWARFIRLISATANNHNSLARDLADGLPTESNFLAGIVERGDGAYPLLRNAYAVLYERSAR